MVPASGISNQSVSVCWGAKLTQSITQGATLTNRGQSHGINVSLYLPQADSCDTNLNSGSSGVSGRIQCSCLLRWPIQLHVPPAAVHSALFHPL